MEAEDRGRGKGRGSGGGSESVRGRGSVKLLMTLPDDIGGTALASILNHQPQPSPASTLGCSQGGARPPLTPGSTALWTDLISRRRQPIARSSGSFSFSCVARVAEAEDRGRGKGRGRGGGSESVRGRDSVKLLMTLPDDLHSQPPTSAVPSFHFRMPSGWRKTTGSTALWTDLISRRRQPIAYSKEFGEF